MRSLIPLLLAAVLAALKVRGETPAEIAGAAEEHFNGDEAFKGCLARAIDYAHAAAAEFFLEFQSWQLRQGCW